MKKTDLFQADRAMSERVAEFMRIRVWGITLKARCKKEIDDIKSGITGLEKLKGSALWENTKDEIVALYDQIDTLKENLDKQVEEEATFKYTETDNTFYNSYKKAEDNSGVEKAISEWFRHYNLEVTGENDIVASIMVAISGKKKASASVVINSQAKCFVEEKRTKGDVMSLFYGTLAERMLEVGTLKPTAIQEDVREMYAPKKKTKKESK